jgi:hypothetical protein
LDVIRIKEKRRATEFANANLKGNARARGRFGKDKSPALAGQGLAVHPLPLAFERDGVPQNLLNVRDRQFFQ